MLRQFIQRTITGVVLSLAQWLKDHDEQLKKLDDRLKALEAKQ